MTTREKLANFKLQKAMEYKGKPIKGLYVYAEPKLDGQRGVIIKRSNKDVKAYTKNGCTITNASHILELFKFEDIEKGFYDGEFLAKDFNDTISIVMSMKAHAKSQTLMFNAFDFLSLKEWDARKCKTALKNRKPYIQAAEWTLSGNLYFKAVEFTRVQADRRSIQEFMEKRAAEGHEGGVFKRPNSFYKFKASKDWLKLKPYREIDCRIVGATQGNGKYAKTLGALILSGKIDGKKVKFKCSGMTDELRDKLWVMFKKKTLLGRICEAKHEGRTVNNAVRFPRLIRLRPDKEKV
jgi:DNA ligase-1